MHHFEQLESVRQLVQARFADYGAPSEAGCAETILVRDNHYCGRRFSCSGWRAVWFVEEAVIKFFDPQGGFCESLDLSQARSDYDATSGRAAA